LDEQLTSSASVLERLAESGALDNLSAPMQTAVFLSSLAFLTTLLVSVTSFTRIVIVLSFVRRALATQEIPSTPTVIGLALFLTAFTMGPVIDSVHDQAIIPYLDKEIDGVDAVVRTSKELHRFMVKHTRKRDLQMFLNLSGVNPPSDATGIPFRTLVPSFMISEIKTAFIMGFCIYIPFILIDLLVSTILMSLGMMMMPPVVVSAPIKLLLFVLVDGWHLVCMTLGLSFLK